MPRRVTGLAPWAPQDKALAVVQIARDLRGEWPLLVRRVLYVAYDRGLYPDKRKGSYDSVGNYLSRARRAGLLPWSAVAETTDRDDSGGYADVADFAATVRDMADAFRLAPQDGQPVYLLGWSEHRGLREVLGADAADLGVPVIYSGGFDSTTTRYVEARAAVARDRPTVVLHFGDFDRQGEDIARVLARDLAALYRDLGGGGQPPTVVRVALTPDQIAEHGLGQPGEPVQVDALPTPVLRALLREAVASRQDAAVLAGVLARERVARETARRMADALDSDDDPEPDDDGADQ